jgi:hypothetical protein
VKVFFKILLIPYFFLWLLNTKIPVGGDDIFLSFAYAYGASLLIIVAFALTVGMTRSSVMAIGLLMFLLAPTLYYQLTGLSGAVAFEHSSGFPTGAVLKLTLILFVFIAFNELLAHRYVTAAYILTLLALAVLTSIPKYLVENYELIRHLGTENRPFPLWIGGWNTYAFVLSLAFVVVHETRVVSSAVKYGVLSVVFGVMITTLSRGAILALLVAEFLSWRSVRKATGRDQSSTQLILAAALLVAVAVATVPGLGATIYDRFVTSFLESQYEGAGYLQRVSSARTVLWVDTFVKLVDPGHYYQWLFGYGVGHYSYRTEHTVESAMGSQYVLFLYEFGWIVGLGLTVLLFRAYARLKWRSDVAWARTIKALFAIFLVSNFVEEFTYTTQVGWLIGVGAALVLDIMRRERALRWRSGWVKPAVQGAGGTGREAVITHRAG